MICSGLHDDYENPPDIPTFSTHPMPKKPRKESLSDALTGAAVAFAKVFSDKDKPKPSQLSAPTSCASPGKTLELRMKNFEQLRYLQQLFDDGILTDQE